MSACGDNNPFDDDFNSNGSLDDGNGFFVSCF